MIKKLEQLKSYLKELKRNQLAIRNGQQQLWSSEKLQSLFGHETFIPQTSWSLQPEAILHLLNIISIKKPKSIIEFGSGVTTLYIAKLLQIEGNKAAFVSIESDLEWHETIRLKLVENKLDKIVRQIHAPIEMIDKQFSFKEQATWYSTSSIENKIGDIDHFDMIIVDGPIGGSTPYARYSAMPFLKNKTSKKSIWFLDDTNRSHEGEIINNWAQLSGLNMRHSKRYSILQGVSSFDSSSFKV
jgi:hypothetical protein